MPQGEKKSALTGRAPLLIVLLLALLIRVLFLSEASRTPFFIPFNEAFDPLYYGRTAEAVLGGDLLAGGIGHSPLYPCVALPLLKIASLGDVFLERLLQAGLGLLTILLLYGIGRRLFDRATALLGAVFASLYAPFLIYGVLLLSETLLVLLVTASLFLLLLSEGGRRRWVLLLCGVATGLAAAAKPMAAVLLPAALLCLFLSRERPSRARPTLLLLGFAIAVAPFVARAQALSGRLVFIQSGGGIPILSGNNPYATGEYRYGPAIEEFDRRTAHLDEVGKERAAYAEFLRFLAADPLRFIALTGKKFLLFFQPEETGNNICPSYFVRTCPLLRLPFFLSFGTVFPLALFGMALALPRARRILPLYLYLLAYALAVSLFVIVTRYRLPVLPVLILFAAFCATSLLGMWRGGRKSGALSILLPLVLALGVFNVRALRRALYPLCKRVSIMRWDGARHAVLFRDDVGGDLPYRTLLDKEGEWIEKRLLLPPSLALSRGAEVLVRCRLEPGAGLSASLNGGEFETLLYEPPQGEPPFDGWLDFRFPAESARPGENAVRIGKVGRGSAAVLIDDYYDFDRSTYGPQGEPPRTDALDRDTCLTNRACSVADGEYMVRLRVLLDRSVDFQ